MPNGTVEFYIIFVPPFGGGMEIVMKRKQTAPLYAWGLSEESVTRRLQEELCTVFIVKMTYPVLVPSEKGREGIITATEAAAERFNNSYARAAEAFVAGGIRVYGEKAREDFRGLPPHERHLFLRRELICAVMAVVEPSEQDVPNSSGAEEPSIVSVNSASRTENQTVTVGTQVIYGTRKDHQSLNLKQPLQYWSFPRGILLAKMPKSKKN